MNDLLSMSESRCGQFLTNGMYVQAYEEGWSRVKSSLTLKKIGCQSVKCANRVDVSVCRNESARKITKTMKFGGKWQSATSRMAG